MSRYFWTAGKQRNNFCVLRSISPFVGTRTPNNTAKRTLRFHNETSNSPVLDPMLFRLSNVNQDYYRRNLRCYYTKSVVQVMLVTFSAASFHNIWETARRLLFVEDNFDFNLSDAARVTL